MKNKGFAHIGLFLALTAVGVVGYFAYTRVIKSEDNNPLQEAQTQEKKAFSFTAAGDIDTTAAADKVLRDIGDAKSDFTLALGDLGYVGNGNEPAWCEFVKQRVGEEYPFELIAGNHDDGSKDGDIAEYAKCLPDRIGNLTGNYGTEYYFDYNDLARIILISPDIDNYGYDYVEGDGGGLPSHLQWVIDAVKDARAKNIDWVVVGMHKNCITVGDKECETGEDLLNNLVDLKVDLVLQGHEHAYFRSKQLSLDSKTCPAIVVNEFNQSCVSNDSDALAKGDGTVIVISGAGGRDLRDVNFDDPEFDYFKAVNGKNSGNTYGFSLFNVSEKSVNASFVPADGSFTDNFSITAQ